MFTRYKKQRHTISVPLYLSGRKDLNLRPLAPHASTLAGLRHAPRTSIIHAPSSFRKCFNFYPKIPNNTLTYEQLADCLPERPQGAK